MTLRRQWLILLTLTAVLAVGIHSVVLGSLINRYFQAYTTANYQKNLAQIKQFSQKTLMEKSYTTEQLDTQLSSYLSDPILRIRLYDAKGGLLADIGGAEAAEGMMSGMMEQMMSGSGARQVDSTPVVVSGTVLGRLLITRYETVGDSLVNAKFRDALIRDSLCSFGIVLVALVFVGLFVSRRMSRDLTRTASMALDIDMDKQANGPLSNIREVRVIQQSLLELQSRLRLRQIGRKHLVDELVHQTRTPLTILKTHLEAMQDGMLQITPDVMQTCEAQIEHLSSIITNMRRMLDAERENRPLHIETFDFSPFIRQILSGLKLQFGRKQVELRLLNQNKAVLTTDPYLLSQCIYNLLTNAYKFTEPGGRVRVSYERSGESFSVCIKDSGVGISPEEQGHLFDAYFKGSNVGSDSGDGLGLYVVKQNLDRLNGSIQVESAPGQGSSFLIRITDGRRKYWPSRCKTSTGTGCRHHKPSAAHHR